MSNNNDAGTLARCCHRDAVSILIPVYNNDCTDLVADLTGQARQLRGIDWEICVAEDGSTDTAAIQANSSIGSIPGCRHIVRSENVGRARIRNILCNEARHPWLIYIDSHMRVRKSDFIRAYLQAGQAQVVDGDYTIVAKDGEARRSLRYRYEKACERSHSLEARTASPYAGFHTANFMISRDLMQRVPFVESFTEYGYEDVLFGAQLQSEGIGILHIDNPVEFGYYEGNGSFIAKTEAAMRSLSSHRAEIGRYSRMLAIHDKLVKWHLRDIAMLPYLISGNAMRRYLTQGRRPSLRVFDLYRLGYFCQCQKKDETNQSNSNIKSN